MRNDYVEFNNDEFIINVVDYENASKVLEQWLRNKALEKILEYIKKYETNFIHSVKEIRIKDQKTRWGSCTYDNRMFFNWRLIMAKDGCLEYVVVHEMCHMVHKNHSKDYWKLVSEIMPCYKNEEKWLKEYAYLLKI